MLLAAGVLVWCLAPLRRVPGDGQVARFIEERSSSLGDRLVTAVDVAHAPNPPALADMMIADAARRSAAIDVDTIVSSESLRRAGFQAAAAVLALGIVLFASRGPARQAFDAASLTLFPHRIGTRRLAGEREGQGRIAAGDSGAPGREPRADHRAGADCRRRPLARRRDDQRCRRLVSARDAVGLRPLQIPRRRRCGDVADLTRSPWRFRRA